MLNIVITGSGSFIGNALRRRLEEFPQDYAAKMVSVRGDDWRAAGFAGMDCVVHAAGIAHVRSDPDMEGLYEAVNRDLTLEVARRARADGVRQFIFLSSMIVYGQASPAGRPWQIRADTPPAPVNAYARSKLEAEAGLRSLENERFRVAVVRPPMVYGKGCKGNYNALVRLADALPVFPALDNTRSVLYVENLAECLRLIIDSGQGGLFFPQDENTVSVREMARMIARARGKRLRFTRCLNPFVRLLGRRGIVRRAFGDMNYDLNMSRSPGDYRRFDTEAGIIRTESGGG